MRLARVGALGAERPVVQDKDGTWRDLSSIIDDVRGATFDDATMGRITAAVVAGELPAVENHARFGPPISGVGKIVCIGLNYRDHAAETGAAIPAEPVVFLKAPDTIGGPTMTCSFHVAVPEPTGKWSSLLLSDGGPPTSPRRRRLRT